MHLFSKQLRIILVYALSLLISCSILFPALTVQAATAPGEGFDSYYDLLLDIHNNPSKYVAMDSWSNIEECTFSLADIDGDGKEELITVLDNVKTMSMMNRTWSMKNGKTKEFGSGGKPHIDFYHTGYMKTWDKNDQTRGGGIVFPHHITKIGGGEDYYLYCSSETVDPEFDKKLDVDKDGVIYYIQSSTGRVAYTKEEFERFIASKTPESSKINIDYHKITYPNILLFGLSPLESESFSFALETKNSFTIGEFRSLFSLKNTPQSYSISQNSSKITIESGIIHHGFVDLDQDGNQELLVCLDINKPTHHSANNLVYLVCADTSDWNVRISIIRLPQTMSDNYMSVSSYLNYVENSFFIRSNYASGIQGSGSVWGSSYSLCSYDGNRWNCKFCFSYTHHPNVWTFIDYKSDDESVSSRIDFKSESYEAKNKADNYVSTYAQPFTNSCNDTNMIFHSSWQILSNSISLDIDFNDKWQDAFNTSASQSFNGRLDNYVTNVDLNSGKSYISEVTIDGTAYPVKKGTITENQVKNCKNKFVLARKTNNQVVSVILSPGDFSSSTWNRYVEEHITMYKSMFPTWCNIGFSKTTREDTIKINNTASRVWDTIKDAGEIASLDFSELQITANYYDMFLSDLMLAFNNTVIRENEGCLVGEAYEKTFDTIEALLRKSEKYYSWEDAIEEAGIESVFSDGYVMTDDVRDAFADVWKSLFKKNPSAENMDIFESIFGNMKCVNEAFDYVNKASSILDALIECNKAYSVAVATKQMTEEFFDFCFDVADELKSINPKFAKWFNESLNKFYNNRQTDAELFKGAMAAFQGARITYETFIQDAAQKLIYNLMAKFLKCNSTNIALVVAAWNAGTALGDLIAGKDTESAYYMYYVTPVESAMQKVLRRYGDNLISNRANDSAIRFDTAFQTLKSTNIKLYDRAYTFAAKHHLLWFKTKNMKENMETANIYKENWKNRLCHGAAAEQSKGVTTLSIQCPVDVYLYDATNNCILAIENESVTQYNDEHIAVSVAYGKKSISYPMESNYRIDVIAREKGKMDYSVTQTTDTSERVCAYYDISLSKGSHYNGLVVDQVGDKNSDLSRLTKDDGKAVSVNYDSLKSAQCNTRGHSFGEWHTVSENVNESAYKYHDCPVCGLREKVHLDYTAPTLLYGDANLDGKVLANDARLVLRASAKLATLTGQAFVNCDLNGDGKLLAGEARKILRYSAKLEKSLGKINESPIVDDDSDPGAFMNLTQDDSLEKIVAVVLDSINQNPDLFTENLLTYLYENTSKFKTKALADGIPENATAEAHAAHLLSLVDETLQDVDLNQNLDSFTGIAKLFGIKHLDFSSVDGIISTIVDVKPLTSKKNLTGDLSSLDVTSLVKNKQAICTSNSSAFERLVAIISFISDKDNAAILRAVARGKLELGSLGSVLKINNVNIDAYINTCFSEEKTCETLYSILLKDESDYSSSAYTQYRPLELIGVFVKHLESGDNNYVTARDANKHVNRMMHQLFPLE